MLYFLEDCKCYIWYGFLYKYENFQLSGILYDFDIGQGVWGICEVVSPGASFITKRDGARYFWVYVPDRKTVVFSQEIEYDCRRDKQR